MRGFGVWGLESGVLATKAGRRRLEVGRTLTQKLSFLSKQLNIFPLPTPHFLPACRIGWLLPSFFLLPSSVFPQTAVSHDKIRIEIINANTLAGSGGMKKLLGNVILRQDNATMTCDSAYLYDGDSRFEGYSNVFINQGDSMTLTGDKVIYDGRSKSAQVTGKTVKLKQGNMTLITDHIDYNMRTKEANYTTGAKMLSAENTLTSRLGTYYSTPRKCCFGRMWCLPTPTKSCEPRKCGTIPKRKSPTLLGPQGL